MSSSPTRRLKRLNAKAAVQTTLANSSIALAVYSALYGPLPADLVAQVREGTASARTVEQLNTAIERTVTKYKLGSTGT